MKQSILVTLFGSALILIASAAMAAGPPPEVQEVLEKSAPKTAKPNLPPKEVTDAAGLPAGCPAVTRRAPSSSLTPEQQATLKALSQEFNAQAQPLRTALWEKHEVFKKLSAAKELDKDSLNRLITDMRSIQGKLNELRNTYILKTRKAGIVAPIGPLPDCPAVSQTGTGKGQVGSGKGYAKFGGSGPRGASRGYRQGKGNTYVPDCPRYSGCGGCPAQ